MKRVFWLGLIALLQTSAFGKVFQYHPHSPLSLGTGFQPDNLYDVKQRCLEDDGAVSETSKGAVGTLYSTSLVTSRKELYEKLNFSTEVSAHFAFFSAGGSLALDKMHSFDSSSLTWILQARSDYGNFKLKNPRLKTEFKNLIAEKDYDTFERMCGREVILQENRGVDIFAIFTVQNLTEEHRNKLSSSFHAGASLPGFGGDLKVKALRAIEWVNFHGFRGGSIQVNTFSRRYCSSRSPYARL